MASCHDASHRALRVGPRPRISGRAAACMTVMLGLAAIGRPAGAAEGLPPARFTDPERRQKLEAALPALDEIAVRWARDNKVPGLAWGIVIDGALARFGSVGQRNVEKGGAIDQDTVFRIASMTKSFTALAILKLRDAGKLELDAPAARYLPELASWSRPTSDSGPVTIRHLLTHTAGFPEDNPWGDRQMAISQQKFSAWLSAGIPYSTATGSAHEYSNYGFAMLGAVVAAVSGVPYAEYVNREILAPLGMTSTWWDARVVPAARLATGYRLQDEAFVTESPLADGAFGPMGGIFTSSRDLSRWVAMMLSAYPPRDDPESPPALRRSLREMHQGSGYPRLRLRRAAPGAVTEGFAINYAFGLRESASCIFSRSVGHSGGFPGYGSYMVWLPEHGVGAFAMAGLTYMAPADMLREMLESLERTGALKPRAATPAPVLEKMAAAVAGLVTSWSDEQAEAIAADNLFLDESLERRRKAIVALCEGLGSCETGALKAENALRGRFRIKCEYGWLDVELTLAPSSPPRVQHLEVSGGRPPSVAMRAAIDEILGVMTAGTGVLTLAASDDRAATGALLQSYRQAYGSCRAGEPQEGDGVSSTRLTLNCDRGPLELTISLEQGRISNVKLAPPPEAICVP